MALNIPSVPYEPSPILSAMGRQNALTKSALENQYYGPAQQADIASKTTYARYLPAQIQAEVLANPNAWAVMGKPQLESLGQQFSNNITNPPSVQSLSGGIPPGNGLLSLLFNKFMNGNQGQGQAQGNPMQGSPMTQGGNGMMLPPGMGGQAPNPMSPGATPPTPMQQGAAVPSPLVPSTGGFYEGAKGKATAPYTQSPYPAGALIPDPNNPGKLISVADAQAVAASQQAIQGISNLKPILQNISQGAERWLAPAMQGKLKAAQTISYLKQNFGNVGGTLNTLMKQTGLTTKDISDFASWQADQKKAVETYMKARQWPNDETAINKVSQIIEPIPGEGKEYGDRVARELAQLEQQLLPNYQQSLGQGFSLPAQGGQSPQSPQPPQSQQPAQNSGLNQIDLGKNGQAVVQATAKIDNKTYIKVNGKWYPQ